MSRSKIVLLLVAILAFAAWINAAQERRGCASCSVEARMAATLLELPASFASAPVK